MKKSNIKRILSGLFAMLMVCCIAFTTQGLTVNAAIVSGGKKNYSYKELKTDLKQLQKKYKDHCQVNVIGKTADKRNLYEVVIGNPNAKKHLLVIGNLHAREHMTVQLCMKQIEYYLNNYNKKINGKKVSATLNKVAIHYVPSCNPDGTAISQKGFNAIRNKSLRNGLRRMGGSSSKWKANARGVDLNRNWKVAFKKAGKKGSSGYRGPKAASEKEVGECPFSVNFAGGDRRLSPPVRIPADPSAVRRGVPLAIEGAYFRVSPASASSRLKIDNPTLLWIFRS